MPCASPRKNNKEPTNGIELEIQKWRKININIIQSKLQMHWARNNNMLHGYATARFEFDNILYVKNIHNINLNVYIEDNQGNTVRLLRDSTSIYTLIVFITVQLV